jgi:hypothetical protein
MKINIDKLVKLMTLVALKMEGGTDVPQVIDPKDPEKLRMIMTVDGCKYTIRCDRTAEALRARIDKLEKTVRSVNRTSGGTDKCAKVRRQQNQKFSMKRGSFKKATYDEMILSGEHENAENYKALFETPALRRAA